MDILGAATFFTGQFFDTYDFTTGTWRTRAITGSLKPADTFLSIWNRPTRKRVLYFPPGQTPTSVVRISTTLDVLMVGTGQHDSFRGSFHRTVHGAHMAAGTAVLSRKTPVEVMGVKGWAVSATVQNTFADVELRSVNENQTEQFLTDGHFFMFLPSDCPAQQHDSVTLGGRTYFILEVYSDSGYLSARATTRGDERTDFVYKSFTGDTYNASTLTNTPTFTSYNTTAKVTPYVSEDLNQSETVREELKILLVDDFISYVPKIKDEVTVGGKSYRVDKVVRDSTLREWSVIACL